MTAGETTTVPAGKEIELYTTRPSQFWNPATPPHHDPEQDEYNVFSWESVRRVATETDIFTTEMFAPADRPRIMPVFRGLWMADGARREALRRLLRQPFAARSVNGLRRTIDDLANDLVDSVLREHPDGCFEAISEIANPLPGLVMAGVLGVDRSAADEMLGWRDDAFRAGGDLWGMPDSPAMEARLQQIVDDCRSNPRPGLLADVLSAQQEGVIFDDGERLEDWEVLGQLAMLLWTVGNTSGSVGDILLIPAEAGCLPEIAANPSLAAGTVEEVLRIAPSFPGIYRTTTADTVFDGSLFVPAGSRVMAWVTAAHRDPTMFPDPHLFDIRRQPNDHLAFGRGAHLCLGAGLVRAELTSMLVIAAQRLPKLRRDPDHVVRRRHWIEDTVDVLHMRFDPPATQSLSPIARHPEGN